MVTTEATLSQQQQHVTESSRENLCFYFEFVSFFKLFFSKFKCKVSGRQLRRLQSSSVLVKTPFLKSLGCCVKVKEKQDV